MFPSMCVCFHSEGSPHTLAYILAYLIQYNTSAFFFFIIIEQVLNCHQLLNLMTIATLSIWKFQVDDVSSVYNEFEAAFFQQVLGFGWPSIFYIESIARVKKLSLSGLLLYKLRIADQFFVQWPQLKQKYPRACYAGRLMWRLIHIWYLDTILQL